MPSSKQQPSNIKHGGGIRPNVWVLTFGPPPTGYGTTTWTGNPGLLTTTVDISECQFVTTPIVTTSLNGAGLINHLMIGMTSPQSMTKDKFFIRVSGLVVTAEDLQAKYKPKTFNASHFGWNINWIAVGFVC